MKYSDTIKEPIITEKSTALSQYGKYTFLVDNLATKHQIKDAFKKIYPEMKVLNIQTLKVRGHEKRTKFGSVLPKDKKKAVITVDPEKGGKIEYFPETT